VSVQHRLELHDLEQPVHRARAAHEHELAARLAQARVEREEQLEAHRVEEAQLAEVDHEPAGLVADGGDRLLDRVHRGHVELAAQGQRGRVAARAR
jgi:hypothetical protein